jgi:hypothetical protein
MADQESELELDQLPEHLIAHMLIRVAFMLHLGYDAGERTPSWCT